jgi:hypothetical protein
VCSHACCYHKWSCGLLERCIPGRDTPGPGELSLWGLMRYTEAVAVQLYCRRQKDAFMQYATIHRDACPLVAGQASALYTTQVVHGLNRYRDGGQGECPCQTCRQRLPGRVYGLDPGSSASSIETSGANLFQHREIDEEIAALA